MNSTGWRALIRHLATVIPPVIALAACGGGGGGDSPAPPPEVEVPSALDNEVSSAAKTALGLTGDPAAARGAHQRLPDGDPLLKLGQLLFFSQTLAAGYDVSCGTCHHPDFAGSDGLSIGVGVVPVNAAIVGPGREIDPARDLDPAADGGPNMHRNSQTTFNAALFDRALLHDGRVFVLDAETVSGGHSQLIQTPESGQRSDPDPVSGLLEFLAKGPLVNDNEMRGFFYTEFGTPQEYREHLVRRLRGEVDTEFNPKPEGPANWLDLFRLAFDAPGAAADEVITIENVQRALAAYVGSQVFVDTPWRDFLNGDLDAISDEAKRGALLFFQSPADGGLGCAGCHTGDRYTDEAFHNVGFPQLGRGFVRADKSDLGRWLKTGTESDRSAFRTPSLLNVAETAPYGHAGSFDTLEEVLAYHADPRSAFDTFDFTLTDLAQFRVSGVAYAHAEPHTRAAIEASSFAAIEAMLPSRPLLAHELARLVAFLESLSDRCVTTASCIGQWTPAIDEDPDGHMLVRDVSVGTPGNLNASGPDDYPTEISMTFPPTAPLSTFPDVEGCTDTLAAHDNTGDTIFTRQSGPSFGLTHPHSFDFETWFEYSPTFEITMIAGGVSAAYLDGDCWPDLIFAGGDAGMWTYRNLAGTAFEAVDLLPNSAELRFTGSGIADLNGDYRRELVLGNFRTGHAPIYAQDGSGTYESIALLPMTRTTFGLSFAPLDSSGYPYLYLAHWSGNGTAGTAPALWKNDGAKLYPWDAQAGTDSASVDQRFNFTPAFADFTGDGLTDLVVASDFSTSASLRNVGTQAGGPEFVAETDRTVISDENGMGSALLDIDNDGGLEWFVTSIYDTRVPAGNWGASGNRLYRNVSTSDRIAFDDITDEALVREGFWGWGACAEDFDNNGFVDLFHVNGFGYIPYSNGVGNDPQAEYDKRTKDAFQAKPSRLFINNGNGSFSEEAESWQIADPSEGRGLACFDYDRDGDVDIVVLDHSSGLQFFDNRSGSGPGRSFLNIRLVGSAPNTDAIGAKVFVTADVGNGFGQQTQMRLSQANSNFNSQNTPDLHFGLGQANQASTIRVVWPGGAELVCSDVATNRFFVLDERLADAACPEP
jgi:enediyne biosynthesis protein E4